MSQQKRTVYTVMPPTPERYVPDIGRWLWSLQDGREHTKRLVSRLDSDLIDWRGDEKSNSIGTLLYHIAVIEIDWLYMEVLERQEFPSEVMSLFPYEVRDAEGRLTPVTGLSTAQHTERLDTTREIFLREFESITRDDFVRVRAMPEYDVTPEWVVHHLIHHEAEHRGQIGEMMRRRI